MNIELQKAIAHAQMAEYTTTALVDNLSRIKDLPSVTFSGVHSAWMDAKRVNQSIFISPDAASMTVRSAENIRIALKAIERAKALVVGVGKGTEMELDAVSGLERAEEILKSAGGAMVALQNERV